MKKCCVHNDYCNHLVKISRSKYAISSTCNRFNKINFIIDGNQLKTFDMWKIFGQAVHLGH